MLDSFFKIVSICIVGFIVVSALYSFIKHLVGVIIAKEYRKIASIIIYFLIYFILLFWFIRCTGFI